MRNLYRVQDDPTVGFEDETAGTEKHSRNLHVFYILPVTTLRTIDLAGKKIPGLLFSGFCVETKRFF